MGRFSKFLNEDSTLQLEPAQDIIYPENPAGPEALIQDVSASQLPIDAEKETLKPLAEERTSSKHCQRNCD